MSLHHHRKLALAGLAIMGIAFAIGRFTAEPHPPAGGTKRMSPPATPRPALTAEQIGRARLHALGDSPKNPANFAAILEALLIWAETDPAGALAYARNHFTLTLRNEALSKLLSSWAARDPEGAWLWTTRQLPDDYTHYDAVLGEVAKLHPAEAWSFATGLAAQKPEYAQTLYVSALRGILFTGNFAQAANLVTGVRLPNGREPFDLASLVAGEWGRYEPEQAAAWILDLPERGSMFRQQALVSLGVAWSQSDPEAAADFAAGLPAGTARKDMLTTALQSWVSADPESVGEWLVQQRQEPDFDLAVKQVATSPQLVDAHVNLAIGWAATIFNDNIRLQSLEQIVARWLNRDPVAARAYLQSTDELPPGTLGTLRSHFQLSESP